MYWDSLTATGVFVSILSTLGAFFLEFHKPPDDRREDKHGT